MKIQVYNSIFLRVSAGMNEINDHNQQPIRFYCDEMLKRLGRWLRAAGYDTRIQENAGSDSTMLQTARCEGRLLVTRDRKLLEFRHAAGTVILLRGNTLNECIAGLSDELRLAEADPTAWDSIPETPRTHAQRLYWCTTCTRIYWEGGHVRRMRARLAAWNDRSGKSS